jgi:hypothetical protein
MVYRDRYADPWEEGSPEHCDDDRDLVAAPAMVSSIPAIAAIDREIARELAAEVAEEEFVGDDEPIGDYAEAA